MAPHDQKTLNDIYSSLGELKGEVKGFKASIEVVRNEVTTIRSDFQSMESGRLTNAEAEIAVLKSRLSIEVDKSVRNTSIWLGILAAIGVNITTAVMLYFILG